MNCSGIYRTLFVALWIAPACFAQTRPTTITQSYDIRDLVYAPSEVSPNFVAPGELRSAKAQPGQPIFGPGGRQVPDSAKGPAQSLSRPERVAALVKLLEETVDPNGWRDNGGQVGAVKEFGGLLIITQTAENQKAIANILSQLREGVHNVVTVRAHWIALDGNKIDEVTKPTKANPPGAAGALIMANMEAVNAQVKPSDHFRAQASCFNADRVRISSGPVRSVSTDLAPVVGNGVVAWAASSTEVVQFGLSLDVTATLVPGSENVLVDVSSDVSEWIPPADHAAATQPTTMPSSENLAGSAPPQLGMLVQHLHSSMVMPVGKPIVVGGMTLDARTHNSGDSRQIYLILEVLGNSTLPE